MDLRVMGFDSPLFSTLQHMLDAGDDSDKSLNAPTRTYVRDAKAMAATPADVKEYPNSYTFIVDMPGLRSGDIKVQVEDGNVLVISGERKREEEKEGSKYVRKESVGTSFVLSIFGSVPVKGVTEWPPQDSNPSPRLKDDKVALLVPTV
eukprot:XP_010648795.1 PREDICTED: 17.9 kDa class II heat shock protein-like [Vitis vinifera]